MTYSPKRPLASSTTEVVVASSIAYPTRQHVPTYRYPTAARDTEFHLHEHFVHCAIWPLRASIGQVIPTCMSGHDLLIPRQHVVSDYGHRVVL